MLQADYTLLDRVGQWGWKNCILCLALTFVLGGTFCALDTRARMYAESRRVDDAGKIYPDFAKNEQPDSRSNSRIMVCYYTIPRELNSSCEPAPSRLDPRICTHIIVGFARVVNNAISLDGASSIYKSVAELKDRDRDLKVMLSVGGMNEIEGGFPEMVKSHANRKRFVESVLKVTKVLRLDGLDIDWEFPVWSDADNKQRIYFIRLLEQLRKRFDRSGRQLLLSVAVAAAVAIIDQGYDIPEIAKQVDFVCLMSYDYHFYVWYLPVTGHNAPLYPRSTEIGYTGTMNVNYSAMYWLAKGMPREKLVIGIPTYGHSYELDNPLNHGLLAPAKNVGKLGTNGFVLYPTVCAFLKYGAKRHFDLESKVPYAYENSEWISYEDEASVQRKAIFVKTNGFKGAMVFSLNADDWNANCSDAQIHETFPLTRAINKVLRDTNYD